MYTQRSSIGYLVKGILKTPGPGLFQQNLFKFEMNKNPPINANMDHSLIQYIRFETLLYQTSSDPHVFLLMDSDKV